MKRGIGWSFEGKPICFACCKLDHMKDEYPVNMAANPISKVGDGSDSAGHPTLDDSNDLCP